MTPPAIDRSSLLRLGACAATVLLVLLVGAIASASADVAWSVTSAHGSQHMAPGSTGQYVIQAFNVGDVETSEQYTLDDILPPGVTATAAFGVGWSCPSLPATGTVTCTSSDSVLPPGDVTGTDARFRGAARPLVIEVSVDLGASGTASNTAIVSGGSPGAVAGSGVDPTVFSSTPAGFGFVPDSFLADVFDDQSSAASPARQAGAHPFEMHVAFDPNLTLQHDPEASQPFYTEPDQHIKTLETRLPAGFIGDPQALPKCPPDLLNAPGPNSKGGCPANTQVGTIDLVLQDGEQIQGIDATTDVPVYNMEPPPGTVAAFALSFIGNPVWIVVSLDPSDYSVVATISDQIELLTLRHADLALWGVPADRAHDRLRLDGLGDDSSLAMNTPFTGAPVRPLLTLPPRCGVPGSIQLRVDSWTNPGAFTPWMTGTSETMTGCDDPRFEFNPSISVQPESRSPGTPTGLDVDLSVPQKDDTVTNASDLYADSGKDVAIATPPVRNATVMLPEGMAVSPSSANGLAACNPLQIKLGTNDEPTCPDASKLGSLSVTTPLLPDPLSGVIYLASQNDNPFASMLALYLVAKGPGVIVKLPGKVVPDPVTGQLTATFDDNPQIPFSKLHLHFDGGPLASLVNPTTCGTKTTTATFTSWNSSLPAIQSSDSFPIEGDCGPRGFTPGFVAGSTNPVAGKDSPIVTRISRADSDQELGNVDVSLPRGLLGRIASVTLCSAGKAAAGTCGDASRIGTVTVGAGPGSDPFFITNGRAFITGPYKGAPYGLSLVVRAKAGPLDLGDVVVRAQVLVNRRTAALRVVTDPLPTILAGIPLQLRIAQVVVDRPHFTFNPTNCHALNSSARITSTTGTTRSKNSRFQVTNCAALPFHPQMSFKVGGKGHTGHGASTALTTVVKMPKGQANLAGVSVALPLALSARLDIVNKACTRAEFDLGHCAAKAGTAVAVTPLLKRPLRGGVFFVRVSRKPAGSLPNLMVALRGDVDVDLTGRIRILGGTRLATNFDTVPDVPVTSFTLRLVSGPNGPLAVATNLCALKGTRRAVSVTFRAQNGAAIHTTRSLHVAGCPAKRGKSASR